MPAAAKPFVVRLRAAPTGLALAWVLGVACQLQQPDLWAWQVYAAIALAAGGLWLAGCRLHHWQRARPLLLWATLAALAFASTGLRAVHVAGQQLDAALEGRDIVVTGVVTGLPRWQADGARFTLAVEQATLEGRPVALPSQLALGWYTPRWPRSGATAARAPDSLHATPTTSPDAALRCHICVQPGERWRMTVRLKQPHGNRNPFGFDYELWLWEQGTGASGYVRNSGRDLAPQRLGSLPWYQPRASLDRLRLRVREAIFRTLAPADADASDSATEQALPAAGAETPPAVFAESETSASAEGAAPTAAASNADAPPEAVAETAESTESTEAAASAAAPASTALAATETERPSSAPTLPRPAAISPQRLAGVIAALVMGDQSVIERGDWNVFRRTGTAHLMSISGLHITMFAWLATGLVGWLWRRSARWGWPLCLWLPAPQAGLWGGVLLAAGYALFSGWGVPAQRTLCMLLVVAVLRHGGRQWPWHAIWALAAAAVLVWDPWALWQAGFWLSFVAVGVLFATGSRTPPVPAASVARRARQTTQRFLQTQGVITLALAPLTLLLFGQVSLIGFVANALAVPVVTLLVTPLALLGVLWHGLWQVAGGCMQLLLAALQWLAAWPVASYQTAVAPLWVGATGVAGGVVLALRQWPWSWRLPGLLCLLPALLWQAPRPHFGAFEVLALDIGQGASVLVRTAQHSLLFDTGTRFSAESNAGQRLVVPLLGALDEKLDVIVLSHADTDHIGGAEAVLPEQAQAQVISSIAPDHPLHQLHEIDRCATSQHWRWDGVDFDVLHPPLQDDARSRPSNAMSCVLRIGNGRQTALLMGDAETAQEAAMLVQYPPEWLRADVLLVGHHGSKTSSSAVWLQAVQPRWALIQHGYRNPYGHPHPTVLQRLAAQGGHTLATDQCGAAWWRSASNTAACERQMQRRYWQHNVPPPQPGAR